MEEKVYHKLEEDGGNNMIFKLACNRDKDHKNLKGEGW